MTCLSSDTSYITFLVSFPQTAFHALFDYRSIYSYISRLISLVLSPVPIHHSLSILYRYYTHCLIASLYVSSLEIASRGLRRISLLLLLLGAVFAPPPPWSRHRASSTSVSVRDAPSIPRPISTSASSLRSYVRPPTMVHQPSPKGILPLREPVAVRQTPTAL